MTVSVQTQAFTLKDYQLELSYPNWWKYTTPKCAYSTIPFLFTVWYYQQRQSSLMYMPTYYLSGKIPSGKSDVFSCIQRSI